MAGPNDDAPIDWHQEFFGDTAPPATPAKDVKDKPKRPATTTLQDAADLGKGLVGGLGRGIVGLPGTFGDIEMLGRLGQNVLSKYTGMKPWDMETQLPTSDDVVNAFEKHVVELPRNEDPDHDWLETAGEWAGGGLGGGLPKMVVKGTLNLVKRAGMDALKKTMAEAARASISGAKVGAGTGALVGGITQATHDPMMGMAAGVPAGIGATILLGRSPAATRLLRGALPADAGAYDAARDASRMGQGIGVPLAAAEALDYAPTRNMLGMVQGRPGASQVVNDFLTDRPKFIDEASRRLLDKITGQDRPDQTMADVTQSIKPRSTLAQDASNVAQDAVNAPRVGAGKIAQPMFDQLKDVNVDPEDIKLFMDSLPKAVADKPSMKASLADEIRGRLSRTVEVPDPQDPTKTIQQVVPITKLDDVDQVIKDFRDRTFAGAPMSDLDAARRDAMRELFPALGDFRKDLRGKYEVYDNAYKPYDDIAPARKQLEGSRAQLMADVGSAGRQGEPTSPGAYAAFHNILLGPDGKPNSVREFRDATTGFDKFDPKGSILSDILERKLTDAFNKAGEPTIANATPPQVGARMARDLGDNQTNALLEEGVRQLAIRRGVNPRALLDAYKNTMSVFQRTGTVPGVGSTTQPRQAVTDIAKGNVQTQMAKGIENPLGIPGTIMKSVLGDIGDSGEQRVYKSIAKMLTNPTPQGITALQTLMNSKAPERTRGRALSLLINEARMADDTMNGGNDSGKSPDGGDIGTPTRVPVIDIRGPGTMQPGSPEFIEDLKLQGKKP